MSNSTNPYLLMLKQGSWFRNWNARRSKALTSSMDIRYKPRSYEELLANINKKRKVEAAPNSDTLTIQIANEPEEMDLDPVSSEDEMELELGDDTWDWAEQDALNSQLIILDEVGQVDEVGFNSEYCNHLLGSVMEDINDFVGDVEPVCDTESELDAIVLRIKDLKLQDPGETIKLYENRTQLIIEKAVVKTNPGSQILTVVSKFDGEKSLTYEREGKYWCETCGGVHDYCVHKICRVIVGDSTINWHCNPDIKPFDMDHLDYLIRSGIGLENILTLFVALYKWEKRPLYVSLLCGVNDILKNKSWKDMVNTIGNFEKVLHEMDILHEKKIPSKLFVFTIPQSPQICRFGRQTADTRYFTGLSYQCENLVKYNKWIKRRNNKLHKKKQEEIPIFYKYGYRSSTNSFGEVKWSMMKNNWRKEEGEYPLHPSNMIMKHFLQIMAAYTGRMAQVAEKKMESEQPRSRLESLGLPGAQADSLLVDTSNNFLSFDLDGIRPNDLRENLKERVGSFLERRHQEKRKHK